MQKIKRLIWTLFLIAFVSSCAVTSVTENDQTSENKNCHDSQTNHDTQPEECDNQTLISDPDTLD